jgi:hypothetical protein
MDFETIKQFVTPWLCPSNLHVIVVGDFPSYENMVSLAQSTTMCDASHIAHCTLHIVVRCIAKYLSIGVFV